MPGPGQSSADDRTIGKAAEIIEAIGSLPAMPHVAGQVIEILSNPSSTPRAVHQLLEKDQGLASRVIKIANSPFYGASRSICSLKDAILFMGFDSIKSVVLTAVMKGMVAGTGLAEKLLWEHSIGCARATRVLGSAAGCQNSEEAYLAGLLHDIGKTVLLLRLPEKMGHIIEEVYNSGEDFPDIERETFGFTHAEVGRLIAVKWRFALSIEEAIANHHDPRQSEDPLVSIVGLANAMCHKLQIGPTRKPDVDLAPFYADKGLGLSEQMVGEALSDLKDALDGGELTWS